MCDDKSVKSCKCNKRFNDSIGHEIKVLNQVLQRKLIYSAKDKGVDKLTLMHGSMIIVMKMFIKKILKTHFQLPVQPLQVFLNLWKRKIT